MRIGIASTGSGEQRRDLGQALRRSRRPVPDEHSCVMVANDLVVRQRFSW
jgi:hypothetical protein